MLGVQVLVICLLVNVDLFKSLTHIDYGVCDHTVVQNIWCSPACFNVALPHPTSVGAGVVRLNLSPVLTLCLFDGSSGA